VGHQQPRHLVVASARRCRERRGREHENGCGQEDRECGAGGWVP
jgi:hypothetical protein